MWRDSRTWRVKRWGKSSQGQTSLRKALRERLLRLSLVCLICIPKHFRQVLQLPFILIQLVPASTVSAAHAVYLRQDVVPQWRSLKGPYTNACVPCLHTHHFRQALPTPSLLRPISPAVKLPAAQGMLSASNTSRVIVCNGPRKLASNWNPRFPLLQHVLCLPSFTASAM